MLPPLPGFRELWGTGVLHCPYCHGYEVRDQPLAVFGRARRPWAWPCCSPTGAAISWQ
ncbi:MAG: hypothetical protein WKG07_11175 [Hymenobacter sp.]